MEEIKPDAIFNLAAQSFVQDSFFNSHMTTNINYIGVLNLYEAIRFLKLDCNIYQASTSEMYGKILETPQTENTPFNPQSPYGISKLAAHHLGMNYRDLYNLNISNYILFNQSELRGREFVTRKITSQLVEVKNTRDFVVLGNLDAVRDWGYAPDYVKAMEMMCFGDLNDDFVVATNNVTTVREFLKKQLNFLDIAPFLKVKKTKKCIDKKTNKIIAKVNEQFYRALEVDYS